MMGLELLTAVINQMDLVAHTAKLQQTKVEMNKTWSKGLRKKSKSSKSKTRLFPKSNFSSSESDVEMKLNLSDSSEFDESDGE